MGLVHVCEAGGWGWYVKMTGGAGMYHAGAYSGSCGPDCTVLLCGLQSTKSTCKSNQK